MEYLIFVAIWIEVCVGFKIFMKLTTGLYPAKDKLNGKTVVVTGASSGLGLECAKNFARRGARVVMVCRDMKKAQDAKELIIKETSNENIKIYQLDFAVLDSVRKCADAILAREERIDVLLNNAGTNGVGFKKQTEDGLNYLMQSNYFGPFLFTNLLLGKLKECAPSRIVNVSSMMHHRCDLRPEEIKNPKVSSSDLLYGNSKVGTILFTNELAKRLEGTDVTVNSLHPGFFSSDIIKHRSGLFKFIWKYFCAMYFKSVVEASQTSVYLCTSPDVEEVSGEYFSDCKVAKSSAKSRDIILAKKIWELSEDAVNLKPNERHY